MRSTIKKAIPSSIALILLASVVVSMFPLSAGASFAGANGKIVFEKGAGFPEVFSINENGTGLQELTNVPSGIIYPSTAAPDGAHIFFSNFDLGSGQGAIYMARVDGSATNRISNFGIWGEISLSPDGSRIAVSDVSNDCLCILNLANGSYAELLGTPFSSAKWSPDGQFIAYSGTDGVYKVNTSTSVTTRLTNHAGTAMPLDWSPDNTKIAYQSTLHPLGGAGSESRLYFMNADGTNRVGFDDDSSGRPPIHINDATYSPDGTKIVYSYDNTGTSDNGVKVVTGFDVSDPTTTLDNGGVFEGNVEWLPVKDTNSVYRYWSPLNQHHFYTANFTEAISVMINYPDNVWTYEGVAFKVPSNCSGASSVHRFWSALNKTHFFTISEAEKDFIIANYPTNVWQYEGVAYCAYTSSGAGNVALHRFWSPQLKGHFYTVSEAEKDFIIANYPTNVWQYEGVGYYVR